MVPIRFSPDVRSRVGDAIIKRLVLILSLLIVLIPVSTLIAQTSIKPFLGRWYLTLKTPTQELPLRLSVPLWIGISESEEQGQLSIRMGRISDQGYRWFSPQVQLKGGEIEFLSPKEGLGFAESMVFKGQLVDGELVGTATSSSGTSWQWIGRRLPALKREGAPKWGKPSTLFNGKDFSGWMFLDPSRAPTWTVENGTLVSNGPGSNIITTSEFEDFKLHLEFNCAPASNSGVYLRGRYEVQIETDSAEEPPSHHTGGVYGLIPPSPELPRKSGEWQSFDITLVARTITVVQNGQTIIDRQEIPGTSGGLEGNEELPGPIMLQGQEKGREAFRNIVIIPAK
jgi:hypothetical protein